MRDLRTSGLIVVLASGCGARTESPNAAAADASSPVLDATSTSSRGPDAGTFVDPASDPDIEPDPVPIRVPIVCPVLDERGPMSGAACAGEVMPCNVSANDCAVTTFNLTLDKWLVPCGFTCGQMAVGVREGCVSEVTGNVGSVNGPTAPEVMECIRSALLGSRWSCAGRDGWYPVVLGSCITR